MRPFPTANPPLQDRPWPYVTPALGPDRELAAFLRMMPDQRETRLRDLRDDPEAHGRFLHRSLAQIYASFFGYPDSPTGEHVDDAMELRITAAKIDLERELIDVWLPAQRAWRPDDPGGGPRDQLELARGLRRIAADNPGVGHDLFTSYLARDASKAALRAFLFNDVVRNEIVDDEVALLIPGTQGLMKSALATNLYDECGRGRLHNFHTHWLRRLLDDIDWEAFLRYRDAERPWFSSITSNVFAMLLTRPAYRPAAYGHFIITEGWVPPHFGGVLAGMRRHDIGRRGADIYFTAHIKLDPTHTEELISGLEAQSPSLEPWRCHAIDRGARLAIAGAVTQYDRMLAYLRGLDGRAVPPVSGA